MVMIDQVSLSSVSARVVSLPALDRLNSLVGLLWLGSSQKSYWTIYLQDVSQAPDRFEGIYSLL